MSISLGHDRRDNHDTDPLERLESSATHLTQNAHTTHTHLDTVTLALSADLHHHHHGEERGRVEGLVGERERAWKRGTEMRLGEGRIKETNERRRVWERRETLGKD